MHERMRFHLRSDHTSERTGTTLQNILQDGFRIKSRSSYRALPLLISLPT